MVLVATLLCHILINNAVWNRYGAQRYKLSSSSDEKVQEVSRLLFLAIENKVHDLPKAQGEGDK
jgi:hypothetical protein